MSIRPPMFTQLKTELFPLAIGVLSVTVVTTTLLRSIRVTIALTSLRKILHMANKPMTSMPTQPNSAIDEDKVGPYRVVPLSKVIDPRTEKRRCKLQQHLTVVQGVEAYHTDIDITTHLGTHVEAPLHHVGLTKCVTQRKMPKSWLSPWPTQIVTGTNCCCLAPAGNFIGGTERTPGALLSRCSRWSASFC
jgi:hypothetical protein